MKKELEVAAIENGTVIDHIPSEKLFTIVNLLGLDKMDNAITIGYNLASKKMGTKSLIKVADRYFSDAEISRLSLVAPNVVLNIIKDYDVIEKKAVSLPEQFNNIIKCGNPKCITNNEPMPTVFNVIDKLHGIVKCKYCEKAFDIKDVKLK